MKISSENKKSLKKNKSKGKNKTFLFQAFDYNCDIFNVSVKGKNRESARKYEGTYISDVLVIRLKFETKGITYNLGVIDDKTTDFTPNDPGNNNAYENKLTKLIDQIKNAVKDFFIVIAFILFTIISLYILKFLIFIFKILYSSLIKPLIQYLNNKFQKWRIKHYKKNKQKKSL